MKRILGCAVVAVVLTGCYDKRLNDLEARMTAIENAHTQTRGKLQSLLVWVNRNPEKRDGLMNWVDEVHKKLWPDSTDVVKPANPPDPF